MDYVRSYLLMLFRRRRSFGPAQRGPYEIIPVTRLLALLTEVPVDDIFDHIAVEAEIVDDWGGRRTCLSDESRTPSAMSLRIWPIR